MVVLATAMRICSTGTGAASPAIVINMPSTMPAGVVVDRPDGRVHAGEGAGGGGGDGSDSGPVPEGGHRLDDVDTGAFDDNGGRADGGGDADRVDGRIGVQLLLLRPVGQVGIGPAAPFRGGRDDRQGFLDPAVAGVDGRAVVLGIGRVRGVEAGPGSGDADGV